MDCLDRNKDSLTDRRGCIGRSSVGCRPGTIAVSKLKICGKCRAAKAQFRELPRTRRPPRTLMIEGRSVAKCGCLRVQ